MEVKTSTQTFFTFRQACPPGLPVCLLDIPAARGTSPVVRHDGAAVVDLAGGHGREENRRMQPVGRGGRDPSHSPVNPYSVFNVLFVPFLAFLPISSSWLSTTSIFPSWSATFAIRRAVVC